MGRNPDRLNKFYEDVKKYHERVPDWRFGQMMDNIFRYIKHNGYDPFYMEENVILKWFDKYFEEYLMK